MQKIGKKIALTITPEQRAKVEKIAERHNLKKAQVYRNMLDLGIELYGDLEKVGIVKLVEVSDKAKEITKDFVKKRQGKLFT